MRALRTGDVLWSPRGPALCLRNPSAAKALGGRGWGGWGCLGSPRTDGPTGRKRPELSPWECVPEDRVTRSPQGSVPGRMGRGVSVPPGLLDTRPRLKGLWLEKADHKPHHEASSPGPWGRCLRKHRPLTLPHPSRPASAQKAVQARPRSCLRFTRHPQERRRTDWPLSGFCLIKGRSSGGGRRAIPFSPTERGDAQKRCLPGAWAGRTRPREDANTRDTQAPTANAWGRSQVCPHSVPRGTLASA